MTKKNEKVLNYILTLGFIFTIVIFLVLIVGISRFVLSDNSSLGAHVKTTTNLLENIEVVENQTTNTDFQKSNYNYLSINTNSVNISDYSYYNTNNNKSFFTIKLNQEIFESDDYLYLKVKNLEKIEKGNILLYNNSKNETKLARVLIIEDDSFEVSDIESTQIIQISKKQLIGELLYKKN